METHTKVCGPYVVTLLDDIWVIYGKAFRQEQTPKTWCMCVYSSEIDYWSPKVVSTNYIPLVLYLF